MALARIASLILSLTALARADDIHLAVRRNDLAAAKAMIDADPAVLKDLTGNQTPLHEAACYGTPAMVALLIERGADINATAYNQFTPLHVARNAESAQLLIKAGANLKLIDAWGNTPLQSAISADELGVAEKMVEAGAPVDLRSALMLKRKDLVKQILALDPKAAKATPGGASLSGSTSPVGLAAQQGDLELVQMLVEAGADFKGGTGMPNAGGEATPLSNAVWGRHAEIVRFLLENGASTSGVGGKFYDSIFDFAVQHSSAEILELLLQHGALASEGAVGFAMRHSPLSMAAAGGDVAKVQLLLKYGADYFNDEDKRRALLVAALRQRAEVVRHLKEHGVVPDLFTSAVLGDAGAIRNKVAAEPASINSTDPQLGRTLLCWVIASGHIELAQWMINNGADANSRVTRPVSNGLLYEGTERPGFNGAGGYAQHTETPLLVALGGEEDQEPRKPDRDLVHLLLEKGADPKVSGWMGATPLGLALDSGDPVVIQDLLAHGADANAKDEFGLSLLHRAVRSRDAVRVLLKHGAEVNAASSNNITALDMAVWQPETGVADELLAHGAKLTLYTACVLGKVEFVRSEIQRDPSLLEARLEGQGDMSPVVTPLVTAAMHGQVEVARVLLDAGSKVNFDDQRRQTPLHAAAQGGSVAVAQLLLERGANVNTDSYIGTPLHIAAQFGQLEMVRFLLDHGAPPDREAQGHGWTPLQAAASWKDNGKIAELLLARGADVNHRATDSGETALHSAAQDGCVEVARVLLDHGADPSIRGSRGKTALEWSKWDNGTQSPEELARKAQVGKLIEEYSRMKQAK